VCMCDSDLGSTISKNLPSSPPWSLKQKIYGYGYKFMHKIGYKGKGLGKHEQGWHRFIEPQQDRWHCGIGCQPK